MPKNENRGTPPAGGSAKRPHTRQPAKQGKVAETGTGGNPARTVQGGASRRRRGRSGQVPEGDVQPAFQRDKAQPAQNTTEKSRSSRGRQTPSTTSRDRSGTKAGGARNPAARTSTGRSPSGHNPVARSADRPAVRPLPVPRIVRRSPLPRPRQAPGKSSLSWTVNNPRSVSSRWAACAKSART
jgi:hypothetical protein